MTMKFKNCFLGLRDAIQYVLCQSLFLIPYGLEEWLGLQHLRDGQGNLWHHRSREAHLQAMY